MLAILLLAVVAAMAMYEPWSLLTPAVSQPNPGSGLDGSRAQAPNDWTRLYLSILYRLGGGEESHTA